MEVSNAALGYRFTMAGSWSMVSVPAALVRNRAAGGIGIEQAVFLRDLAGRGILDIHDPNPYQQCLSALLLPLAVVS